MEIMKKKKGFTLIELMIVLAIIAILAVVLIPKSTIFKNNSKNAGVTTNVNTVRAYLETKITDGTGTNSYLTEATSPKLSGTLQSSFGLNSSYVPTAPSSTDSLVNPFDKTSASIIVYTGNTTDIDSASTAYINNSSSGYSASSDKGKVVIEICPKGNNGTTTGGYIVYGIDNGGAATTIFRVK